MDGFLLKKIVAGCLYPLPVCLGLLLVGVALCWTRKRQAWGRVLVTAAALLLLAFTLPPVPGLAVRSLERQYVPYTQVDDSSRAIRWVVVLGGGTTDAQDLPVNDRLSASSLQRVVEGVRVLRLNPQARLLLCGGRPYSDVSEASVMRDMAVFLGVEAPRIRLEDQSLDTADQALHVRAIVGDEPLVLVTTALHLPRAMGLFRKQGMAPVPAPTGYFLKDTQANEAGRFLRLMPGASSLEWLRAAWHEHLGVLWSRLRGQI